MTKKNEVIKLDIDTIFDYGVNIPDRIITISDDIEAVLFHIVDSALSIMESINDKPITIRINSFGGEIYSALGIIGRIKNCKCQIITEGYGAIMSSAGFIFVAGSIRKISKYAWFMFHEMSFSSDGKLKENDEVLKQSKKEMKFIYQYMADHSKKSVDFWKKLCKKGDTHFNASESLLIGVADEII